MSALQCEVQQRNEPSSSDSLPYIEGVYAFTSLFRCASLSFLVNLHPTVDERENKMYVFEEIESKKKAFRYSRPQCINPCHRLGY
jgi:hypothetical protein